MCAFANHFFITLWLIFACNNPYSRPTTPDKLFANIQVHKGYRFFRFQIVLPRTTRFKAICTRYPFPRGKSGELEFHHSTQSNARTSIVVTSLSFNSIALTHCMHGSCCVTMALHPRACQFRSGFIPFPGRITWIAGLTSGKLDIYPPSFSTPWVDINKPMVLGGISTLSPRSSFNISLQR